MIGLRYCSKGVVQPTSAETPLEAMGFEGFMIQSLSPKVLVLMWHVCVPVARRAVVKTSKTGSLN